MKEYVNVEKVFVSASVTWDLCERDSELAKKYVKSKLAHLIAEELLEHHDLVIFKERDFAPIRAKVITAILKIATIEEEEAERKEEWTK